MITVNESLSCLADLRASLTDGNLAAIDFDRLAAWLADLAPLLERSVTVEVELQTLRDDYIARITGMAKAIAAAQPTPDSYSQTVEFIDSLPSFTATQLLDTCRRVAARFRDTFPASHGRPFAYQHH